MSRGMPRLPRPLMDLWDWQSQAACRDVNPELFFSPESERGVRKRAREMVAKSLCGTCPVQPECRQHALAALARHTASTDGPVLAITHATVIRALTGERNTAHGAHEYYRYEPSDPA